MGKIRVLIADDHTIVREGVYQLLNAQPDMEVVGEAEDGLDVLKKARSIHPDIILLDIGMPGLNGLEAIRLIKEAVPDIQIVVLSMHKKEAYVHQALNYGALGYVLKASSISDLLDAIRGAHRKEYFLSPKIRTDVISVYLKTHEKKHVTSGYDLLSSREQQVFRLMVEGNSTNQIANILCLSPKTVEKHRANIMNKLDIHDLVSLMKYAIKIGIIDPELWED